ncbi:RipA family octameric membrane protein [Prevotella intermedia]|uniref:Uncharacterized protein n=1 Tax=Prevotella intermedia TaxID=28131 RepID=A0A2G9IE11_PREIN|nr:hypothetical protein [Prevotella intermedia]PIN27988.1 hypothetical protein CUC04_00340 [Prevotella intermedia]
MEKEKREISKENYIKEYKKEKLEKALEIALDTRKFEIGLYWKRTGYFVIFIGAVFVGYYTILSSDKIKKEQQSWLLLILPALGFLLSLLWHMANRGSKFWQENWEAHIEELSTHLGIPIFGIIKSRKHSICNVMGQYPFSVSKVNQMVSLFITISWVLVFIKEVLSFPSLKIDLSFLKEIPFWIFIIGLLIILLVIFQCRGFAAKTPKKRKNADYFYNYGEKKKCECHLWCKIKQLIKKIPLIESLS